jgi:LPXTG-site transpeptidase (sortase) family protein
MVQPSHDLEQEQIIVESTPAPFYQVIEEQPPDGSLVIPSLGIDQPVVPITVRDQVLDLADLGTQIGWLQTTGSHPNDDLAMVLIGHITLPYPGGAGPFLNLSALKPGDFIGYRSRQVTYIYEVKGQTIAKPDQVDLIYRPDGKILLLVTCDGYNALEWKYDLRLIVEAVLISVEK